MNKEDLVKELGDLLWDYYAYKEYPKKLDLVDFLKWLKSMQ